MNMDRETENQVVDALRKAINTAVRAGMSLNYVRIVVKDQLHGIEHLGGGDVDKMLAVAAEQDAEIRRKAGLDDTP